MRLVSVVDRDHCVASAFLLEMKTCVVTPFFADDGLYLV